MTTETIEKIRAFYRPEFSRDNQALLLHGREGKTIDVAWKRKYYLTFGEGPAPKSLDEARERGFPSLTGRELFEALLSPEDFEAVRATKELDPRTAAYVEATKKGIGLVGRKDGYDGEKFTADTKINLGIGPDGYPVEAEIGQLADGRWVAEWSVRTAIDDYCITDLFFDRQPSAAAVNTAMTLDHIESGLAWQYHFNPAFRCWECGRSIDHWLDINAESLEAKWDSFKERYCGC